MSKQKIEGKNYPIKDGSLAIWRNINGDFVPCTPAASEVYCQAIDFDFEHYISLLANQLGVDPEDLPIGYYFTHHWSQSGNYLETDDFDEMIGKLRLRGLV